MTEIDNQIHQPPYVLPYSDVFSDFPKSWGQGNMTWKLPTIILFQIAECISMLLFQ